MGVYVAHFEADKIELFIWGQAVQAINEKADLVPPARVLAGGWAVEFKLPVAVVVFGVIKDLVRGQTTVTAVGSALKVVHQAV